MSFGAMAPFDWDCLALATGVLSLSPSLDRDGVAGTFKGRAVDIRYHWTLLSSRDNARGDR
jgi:hypothetical protein